MHKILVFIIVALLVLPSIPPIYGAEYGYLAIKDFLGKVWTMDDVQKIMNTTLLTPDGVRDLGDYFIIVINDNYDVYYTLENFTASPLDNKTAVLPLPPGDHIIDIYWFGYHQRQLVHIVENQHYIINIETAPVMPLSVNANEPPETAEWDLVYNPEGLTIQRYDGNAWVRFNYDASYITVAWYDDDTGWNYYPLDIYIDTNYQYKFHINDPSDPEYYEIRTGSFLWLTWDIYRVKEIVRWNRTGEILHVSYIVAIAENEGLLQGAQLFWSAVANDILANVLAISNIIDPITYTIVKARAFTEYIHSAYDTYMAMLYSSQYQKTVLLVWDVFCTPTQVVVLAHAYDVLEDGTLVKKSITSENAVIVDNRLVFIKQLSGSAAWYVADGNKYVIEFRTGGWAWYSVDITSWYEVDIGGIAGIGENNPRIRYPSGEYFIFYVDDLSKYTGRLCLQLKDKCTREKDEKLRARYRLGIILFFNDTGKADIFEQRLAENNIPYSRNGNLFRIELYDSGEYDVSIGTYTTRTFILWPDDIEPILDLIPANSPGYLALYIGGYVKGNNGPSGSSPYDWIKYWVRDVRVVIEVMPRLVPPQMSLLTNGYQKVENVFAVQVFSDLYSEDNSSYVLCYYLLDNEPPPMYIIRDIHYDDDSGAMHYVHTLISVDAYGQDIMDMYKTYNDTTHVHEWYLNIKPTIRLLNFTLALVDLNRMSFLNLDPALVERILLVPPTEPGAGVPIIDWSSVYSITVNLSRPYELYYYKDGWIRAYVVFDNETLAYTVLRYSDNSSVETLLPGNVSQYYYKLVYTDTMQEHRGFLRNDNGMLKLVAVKVVWTVPYNVIQRMLEEINLKGIMDRWNEAWEDLLVKLGLLQPDLPGLSGFSFNWHWLLLGLGVLVLLVLVMSMASRPKIIVAR